MNKLSTELGLQALAIKFDVNAKGVDGIKAAIGDGTIWGMLQTCADEKFDGDLKPVLAQFNRNLSSQRCTRRPSDTAAANRAAMVELLWAMTHDSTKAPKAAARAPKAGFQYTVAEVEDLFAAGDVEELQRMYNNVHSNVSKKMAGLSTVNYAEAIKADPKLASWLEVKEAASKRLSELKAAKKAGTAAPAKVEVSADLTAKLMKSNESGKAATLTAAQVKELLKLLGQG